MTCELVDIESVTDGDARLTWHFTNNTYNNWAGEIESGCGRKSEYTNEVRIGGGGLFTDSF